MPGEQEQEHKKKSRKREAQGRRRERKRKWKRGIDKLFCIGNLSDKLDGNAFDSSQVPRQAHEWTSGWALVVGVTG